MSLQHCDPTLQLTLLVCRRWGCWPADATAGRRPVLRSNVEVCGQSGAAPKTNDLCLMCRHVVVLNCFVHCTCQSGINLHCRCCVRSQCGSEPAPAAQCTLMQQLLTCSAAPCSVEACACMCGVENWSWKGFVVDASSAQTTSDGATVMP